MSERQGTSGTVDRLYPLDGGLAMAPDRSEYSPGIDKGMPVALSCNAYLIQRAGQWILWDTGIQDELYFELGGKVVAHNIRGIVSRPIATQLHELGLQPKDIGTVILSHGHFDHAGNCNMFPDAIFYVQEMEHQAMFGPDYKKYGYVPKLYDAVKEGKVELLSGDTDLFADGSMRIFSTPGHTPGHSSLLVNLPRSGSIMLAADVAHYRLNLDQRLVPKINSDVDQSVKSMDKLDRISKYHNAQIWLNHDIRQQATIQHAPTWFD
jgi:glyoxylase-like metal-dependent hydrolase (beta-lactamase superfamily II)